uniref:CP-type G domain-containing protein n=1 Tax=Odontella aurita TaxID=265563 RepID=A0A7S4NA62_9STRA
MTAAFDKMARAEGFDPTTASFADASSFDDEFDYENLPRRFDFDDGDDDDGDFVDDDDDDDFLDFGDENEDFSGTAGAEEEEGGDSRSARASKMAERIAAARTDLDRGRVNTADDALDEVSETDLRRLGFRRESNPFGNDETPRRQDFAALVTDAMTCPACGSDFQCRNETKPGYLPPEKFEVQSKLGKIEEMRRLQEKADGTGEWSPEDEIEWLIQSEGGGDGAASSMDGVPRTADGGIDIHAVAEEMGLDLAELSSDKKKVICRRCHRLQNFGDVEDNLRPGWTEEPLLSQEAFRDLLRPIRDKECVVVALVDLFDFSGSVLPELDAIAGDNPVVLAANKADLLPTKMGQTRAENWVRRELEYLGVKSIGNFGGAVRLVSCKSGFGMSSLLNKVRSLAEERECDVYVVGSANAGKSTLINHILDKNDEKKLAYKLGKKKLKKRAGNANARKGDVTVSPLPGTTLKFIKVDLGNGVKLYDTPGLLVPGTMTQRLTPAELKIVVPKKEVEPVTFRVASGKCVLVGGLARIEVTGNSKPFLFTFFVANDIKLHPTDVKKADEFVASHAGGMLTPPFEPGQKRMDEIGEFEPHDVVIEGAGWKEAAADIALRGLGWVSVTGAGVANVRISVPRGVGISVRPPLMPFDIWEATARYTGGRAVRKGGKTKSGKTRKGVGRR